MKEHAYTVSEILDRFKAEYVPNLAPRTQRDYTRHIETLRRWFGHRIANELKAKDFREFMHVAKGKIHRNRLMAVLSCAFGEAVGRWYWADANPCRDVKRHPSRPRDRYVTDEEYNAFKAMVPLRMQLAMELSLLTGQRQGDILGLTWDKVDRPTERIRFRQSKTGKRLAVRITPAIAEVLERCEKLSPPGPNVIRRRDGQRYSSDGFRAIFQRHQRRWAALGHVRFSYHDLRAKSASDSETIEAAYQRLGHTSMAITRSVYDRGERLVDPLR
jgi:integrase